MKRATLLPVLLASGVVFGSAQAFASSDTPAASSTTPATSASAAAAQDNDAAATHDFQTGEVNINVTGRNSPESSKFEEYRDVVKGISMPSFRFFGNDGKVRFDLRGENVKQLDERYTGSIKTEMFAVSADYNAIIHRIGNNGRTLLTQQRPGEWRMSDTLQQAIQNNWESTPTANRIFTTYVAPLFLPSINEGSTVDVRVQRQRTEIVADLARNQPFNAKVSYFREQRHGSGGLSSNYLSYQTETPSVTEYLTQDVGLAASVDKPWGNARAGLHYNWFNDQVPSLVFDSPFRVTDALAATVGTGTAATSVGGPTYGRMVNPPTNNAYTTTLGATFKLPSHTRIMADASLGRWAQNEPFFPYLTNTAVVTPVLAAQTSSLPARSLNGKINTTSLAFSLTSRPTDALQLALRFRRYELDNQTPRIAFPGYGSWDRSFSATARISAPFANTTGRLDASVGYNVGMVTLEGAFRRSTIDRTFRETEQTQENAASVAAVVHVSDTANLRAVFEKASRDYSGLELELSEDATFVVAPTGLPANVLNRAGNLRFDQSKRDSNRAGLTFDVSPTSMTTLAFSYTHNNDTYKETAHGLQDAGYDAYSADIAITPSEQWNLLAYFTHDNNGNRQIQNGTSNFPAAEDFTVRLTDKADTAGLNATFGVVPNKATLNLGGRYQNLTGTAGFTTNPGSSYQLARASMGGVKDIPNADNVKITRLDASVEYVISPKVTFTAGTWYEDYVFSDVDSVGLQNIYPGAFFLALNDGSYTAKVGYVRLTYHW